VATGGNPDTHSAPETGRYDEASKNLRAPPPAGRFGQTHRVTDEGAATVLSHDEMPELLSVAHQQLTTHVARQEGRRQSGA